MSIQETTPSVETPVEATQGDERTPGEMLLRRWVTCVGVAGTAVLAAFFFLFMAWQTVLGEEKPGNWLRELVDVHYAALIGIPMSAVTAFCIVSLLKVTNGAIEFEAIGFKFRGASGPIVLWILCFLVTVIGFHLLWHDLA